MHAAAASDAGAAATMDHGIYMVCIYNRQRQQHNPQRPLTKEHCQIVSGTLKLLVALAKLNAARCLVDMAVLFSGVKLLLSSVCTFVVFIIQPEYISSL